MFHLGWREWAKFAGHCLIAASCISALVLLEGWSGWSDFARDFGVNFLFCVEIGGLAWMTIPFLARRMSRWPAVPRWLVLIVALAVDAVLGTLLAIALLQVLSVLRIVPGDFFSEGDPFLTVFVRSLQTAVPITLFVGVISTVIESSKERLRTTEVALRTQQVERERAEKLAAEAQFASLTSRVQPHFLFNTLNSIAALIRENPQEAEHMVERLGALLRSSLDSAQTVPVEQELKLVTDYLEIQRTRLGDRLRYHIDWSPQSFNGGTLPPFAVQTLVENALKHVAGQRQEGVSLLLSARSEAGAMVVDVDDDGPGFGPEALRSGHGLDNLQQRLRALYGEHGRLDFERTAAGMRVTLRVPA